nr:hypothetical protein [Olleya namhaensis]
MVGNLAFLAKLFFFIFIGLFITLVYKKVRE